MKQEDRPVLPQFYRAQSALTEAEATRFWAKVEKSAGCWLWTAATGAGGYGVFKLRGRSVTAHRLSLIIATGDNPAHLQAAHSCSNPRCCNPVHLRWATHQENQDDKRLSTPARAVKVLGVAA